MKKQTFDTSNLHCVQCGNEFVYKVSLDSSVVSICHHPECPNYGLLAMPKEQMPKEKNGK